MKLTSLEQKLYVETQSDVIGHLVNKGRTKPAAAAHRAADFAEAAVQELRIRMQSNGNGRNGTRNGKRS